MKLYGQPSKISTNKALVFLAEKSVVFNFTDIRNLDEAKQKFPQYYNVAERRPVLIDSDEMLIDSIAICNYIEEKFPHPKLFPSAHPKAGLLNFIEQFYYGQLHELTDTIDRDTSGEYWSVRERGESLIEVRLKPFLRYLESVKEDAIYLVTNEITVADISLGVALWKIANFDRTSSDPIYPDLSVFRKICAEFPRISDYCNLLWTRKSFRHLEKLSDGIYPPE